MNALEMLQAATAKSQAIVARYQAEEQPDVLAARAEELHALKKDELIQLVLTLEKPKSEKAFRVEDIVKDILEEPACAILTYEQVATLVHQVLPDAKTSSKSVASYASRRKEDWDIVSRERLNIDAAMLLSLASNS